MKSHAFLHTFPTAATTDNSGVCVDACRPLTFKREAQFALNAAVCRSPASVKLFKVSGRLLWCGESMFNLLAPACSGCFSLSVPPSTSLLPAADTFLLVPFGVHLTNTHNPPALAALRGCGRQQCKLGPPSTPTPPLSVSLSLLYKPKIVLWCFTADGLW